MVPDDVSWQQVVFFLIVSAPGIIAAFYSHRNASSLKTEGEKTVGTLMGEVHDTAAKAEAGTLPASEPDAPDGPVVP